MILAVPSCLGSLNIRYFMLKSLKLSHNVLLRKPHALSTSVLTSTIISTHECILITIRLLKVFALFRKTKPSLQWRHNGRDGVSNHQPQIVYSSVYSGTDQRKHQSFASLAFVRGIHRWPVNSPHKRPVTRKMFPFDDGIMWYDVLSYFVSQW